MIFSFSKDDPVQGEFFHLLREANVDYEVIAYDRNVIRLFGEVNADLQERLQALSARGRMEVGEEVKDDIFLEFRQASEPVIIAGPCAVESEAQMAEVTAFLAQLGVKYIRAGAFKPRTSPESFQGLGERGLKIVTKMAREYRLKIVTEVMDRSQIEIVRRYADIIQVGSRNMYNYALLVALGALDKPILLKRGMSATLEEWLAAARYIHKGGNASILLCERGIRTFEPNTRNTLDVSAIPLAQKMSDYPVIADPSHAAGRADLVPALAMAAVAAGANGVMIEIHPHPDQALSDPAQALSFSTFQTLIKRIRTAKNFWNT